MTTVHPARHDSHSSHEPGQVRPHIMSPKALLTVYAVLVAATAATVAVTYVDLGALNIWAALAIAVFKGALVILFFMHIKYDAPIYGIALIAALSFVMVFIGVAMLDSSNYQMNYHQQGTRQMMSSQDGL